MDKENIGTKDYQGLAWFHSHTYRMFLRCRGDYFDGTPPEKRSNLPWNKRVVPQGMRDFLDLS